MKVLVLHLSDIHIANKANPILGKAQEIVDAVKNLEPGSATAIVAITGDMSFAGTEEQYLAAMDFIGDLRAAISREHDGHPIHVAMVPGNHDCRFTEHDKVREIMVQHIKQSGGNNVADDMISPCVSVQSEFFDFRDAVTTTTPEPYANLHTSLAYQYRIAVGDEVIQLLCLNTAWISELHEQQGSLVFPTFTPMPTEDVGLAITLFHHPYNWFQSVSGKSFRSAVDQVSDLVLTGHEHDPEQYSTHAHGGRSHLYLAGGVLQALEHHSSSFYALVVDTDEGRYKSFELTQEGDHYVIRGGMSPANVAWEDFGGVKRANRGVFALSRATQEFLEDPGLNLTHRSRSTVTLSDIFVPPDVRELTLQVEDPGEITPGGDLPGLLDRHPYVFILGDDQSGKTTLGKHCFRLRVECGDVPVWLDAAEPIPGNESRLLRLLEEQLVEQYSSAALDSYRRLDRGKRVIIVDNYHRLGPSPRARVALLALLVKHAGRVILLAHELSIAIGELASPKIPTMELPTFKYFRLQPLTYTRRNELVEKWLSLNDETARESPDFIRNVAVVTRTLDTVIGHNYVPAYPVYVLSVLQASEAMTPVDTRASAHGYYYELFIRLALSHGTTSADYDIIASYLAHLAYKMYDRRVWKIDDRVLEDIHADFQKETDLVRPLGRVVQQLLDNHILMMLPGEELCFKYRFMYYYFVALYMRDHITDESVRGKIGDMARRVHVEDYANILLFLSHLCKDSFIVNELMTHADTVYKEHHIANLDTDIGFLGELEELSRGIVLEDGRPEEERRRLLEQQDMRERGSAEPDYTRPIDNKDEGEVVVQNPIMTLNGALKTLEILGQILRNFPGSLSRDTKLDVARACYNLGLRTLSAGFGLLQVEAKGLLQMYAELAKEVHPKASAAEIEKLAARSTTGLAWIIATGLIGRIAVAVGSRDLAGTYERLLAESPVTSVRLIDASISIDHSQTIPTEKILDVAGRIGDRWFPRSILAHFTVRHCQLFHVNYRDKQKLAAGLGINYKRVLATDPGRRLTS